MSLKIVFLLALVSPIFGQNLCRISGPNDFDTQRGLSFIESASSGICLRLQQNPRFIPGKPEPQNIIMEPCSWNRNPVVNQLFNIRPNPSVGGSLVKPSEKAGGVNACIAPHRGNIVSVPCQRGNEQSWEFLPVPGRRDIYQMMQVSSGRCLRASSKSNGASTSISACNARDALQLWRICPTR